MTLVSVCIASFNQEEFISDCLVSVLTQKTNFEFEIIIGDDASTDKSQHIIRRTCKNKKNCKFVLREKNLGCPFNGLDILAKANSKYIAIIDGDDYWTDPYKLQKQVDYLEQNSDCSFCFTDCQVKRKNNLQEIHPNLIKKAKFDGIDFADQKGSLAQTCTWLVKRDLLQNLPTWVTESYTGDWCMQVHFSTYGKGGYIPENTAVYRIHDGGMWSKLDEFNAWRKNLEFYRTVITQFSKKEEKKRIRMRLKSLIFDSLEFANVQANKKEIRYWLSLKLKKFSFFSILQTLHSLKLLALLND